MLLDNLKNFFYPASLCLAGASSKEKSIGYELLKTILSYGYKGSIYPVNPKAGEILGVKCYASVKDIPSVPELAIVAVPKAYCYETIEDLLNKGTRSIVLITAGFRETGKEGEDIEGQIISLVKRYGARMIGPNCMGVINTHSDVRLNATFVAESPESGRTGFLSQSGALGAAVLNSLRETNIRFSHFISVGNKADINENDIIRFWQTDTSTDIMTLYLESFSDGKELIDLFADRKITKPVIVLKAGRTESGMKAAASHTGAIAGSDAAAAAVMKQFGIIRAAGINELFNTAKGFEHFPLPGGRRVAIVTNAGGPAIIAADACERRGLVMAELTSETKSLLRSFVHAEGSVNNPVDLLPGGTAEIYLRACTALLNDENVDAVISIFVEPVMVQPLGVTTALNSVRHHKPLMQVIMPLPSFWSEYPSSEKPVFRNPEDPAEIISNMLFFSEKQRTDSPRLSYTSAIAKHDAPSAQETSHSALMQKYNIPVVPGIHIDTHELNRGSISIPETFTYPVVVKGVCKNVSHKSEMNAVALNVGSQDELMAHAERMQKNFSSKGLVIDSFLIQPFLKARFEILLGGYRDPAFGPMLMFGSGGKYVEVYRDTSMKSAYMNDSDIDDMIASTKMGRLLCGVRGEKPADINAVRALIKNSAQMMLGNPGIMEFDFNPVVLTEDDRLFAVDIRIRTAEN